MMERRLTPAEELRELKNAPKAKTQFSEKVTIPNPQPIVRQDDPPIIKIADIECALTILKAPKPRPQLQLSNGLVDLSSGAKAFDLSKKPEENADARLSARIFETYFKFIISFKPLHYVGKKKKKNGAGSALQELIEDYNYFYNEEIQHIKEVIHYLNDVRNSEKSYALVFKTNTQEEVEAKEQFQNRISDLRAILNAKRMNLKKLLRLLNANMISRQSYDEIHYYFNFEIYEQWEIRGGLK